MRRCVPLRTPCSTSEIKNRARQYMTGSRFLLEALQLQKWRIGEAVGNQWRDQLLRFQAFAESQKYVGARLAVGKSVQPVVVALGVRLAMQRVPVKLGHKIGV